MSDTREGQSDRAIEDVFYPDERIPFVNWQQFSGAKPTVLLVGAITLLAFVTGLSNLSQASVALDGPLAPYLPVATGFARFGGVLFAFLLGPVTVGLQRRKAIAWRIALVLLPALALLPLTTLQTTDVPLLLVVLVTIPLLVWNRDQFDQALDLSPLQIASLSSVLGVVLYGTVGAYGLRGNGLAIESWSDAVYYVIVTISTVGYGDVTPTTPVAKWFSLSIILLGTGAFTVSVGALVGPAIESRMASAFGNMTVSELKLLEDHVVVLGHGDLTASLLETLEDETDVVVVTDDADVAADLTDEDVNVLTDDPTDESVLADAQVETARGVVAGSRDDAQNVLAVLASKTVAPDVRVVAAANEQKHADKLASVGADEIINPRTIGGRLLGRSVLDDEDDASLTAVLGGDEDSESESGSGPGSGLG
ncbi:MAG: NAD-binding protein [Haloglomus sp.]